jgi:hypothetical protein
MLNFFNKRRFYVHLFYGLLFSLWFFYWSAGFVFLALNLTLETLYGGVGFFAGGFVARGLLIALRPWIGMKPG